MMPEMQMTEQQRSSVAKPKKIDKKRVLLVDDVMTSCATTNEVTKVLKQSGAISVHVAVIARGVKSS